MSEATDNLILEHLRHIRAKVDKLELGMDEIKIRLTRLETTVLSIKREITDGFETDIH